MEKVIGILLLVSVGLAFLGGMFSASEDFFTAVALALMVLGVWGGVLLLKVNK